MPSSLHDLGVAVKDDTVFLLQEVPRREAGWQTDTADSWTMLNYRHADRWRGTGILFKSVVWKVVRRLASDRGTWFRMRHVLLGCEMWVGTAHLDPGCTQVAHRAAVEDHLGKLKPTTLPILCAADINSPLRWEHTNDGDVQPFGKDGKTVGFLEAVSGRGLRLAPPRDHQLLTATSRPRQAGREGRQIDCICYRGASVTQLDIHVDTHRALGTDHEMISCGVQMRGQKGRQSYCTRPRVWVKGPATIEKIDQPTLTHMAKSCTKPKPGRGYRDPEPVKAAVREARRVNTIEAWKRVQKLRKQARKGWENNRIREAATGDWEQVRKLRATRNVG